MLLCSGRSLLDVSIMFSSFRQKLLSVAEVNPLKILSFLVCSVFFFFAAFCDSHEASEHFKEYCC